MAEFETSIKPNRARASSQARDKKDAMRIPLNHAVQKSESPGIHALVLSSSYPVSQEAPPDSRILTQSPRASDDEA